MLRQGASTPRTDKASLALARALEARIVDEQWPIGESLGLEPELLARYPVSRAVLREAVRILEYHGVAEMKRGPGGGLIVRVPDVDSVNKTLRAFLGYTGATAAHLFNVRVMLETRAAGLAARRSSVGDVAVLRHALVRSGQGGDLGTTARGYEELHVAIAKLTGNPVLELLTRAIVELSDTYLPGSDDVDSTEPGGVRPEVHDAHRGIVEAILDHDPARAEHLMNAHLTALRTWLIAHSRFGIPGHITARGDSTKLAEAVTRQLYREIETQGWPIGASLGSEQDIMTRYGVGRSVARESVRLMEMQGVARMLRGPNGGLTVTRPHPDTVLQATSLYFDSRQATVQDVHDVREALEFGCLDAVVGRVNAYEMRPRIEAALVESNDGIDLAGEPDDHHQTNLHTVLADLTGNPVLSLFLRLLTLHWARHTEWNVRGEVNREVLDTVSPAHRAIADAVLAGDAETARLRMSQHLDRLTDWWE